MGFWRGRRQPGPRRFRDWLRGRRWVLSVVLVIGSVVANTAGIASGWDDVGPQTRSLMIALAAVLTALISLAPGILQQAGPAPARPVGAGPVPRQLPPVTRYFTGRENVLARMRTHLESTVRTRTTPLFAVNGKGGVGKTALALRLADELTARYPDGQLYTNLRGQEEGKRSEPAAVLVRFLAALGLDVTALTGQPLEDLVELYHAQLVDRRVLILLDNAWNESQVRPLLPRNPDCAVLVTSRRKLAGLDEAYTVELGVISPAESVELLGKIAGHGRIRADPQAAADIARLTGQLPLAVRLAGAKLRARPHWTPEHLADRLRDERGLLTELELGEQALRASVELSYGELGKKEQRAFRLLGLVQAASFTSWALAALIDTDLDEADRLLEELVDAQLLDVEPSEHPGPTRYRFHDVIRAYAQVRTAEQDSNRERNHAIRRLLAGYLTMAEHAKQAIAAEPGGRLTRQPAGSALRWRASDQRLAALARQSPRAWFSTECAPLARAIEQAHDHQHWELCWEIAAQLCTYFESLRGFWTAWQRTFDLALNAARRAGSRHGQALLLHARGAWFRDQDRFAEAGGQFTQALNLFRTLRHASGQAQTLSSLGEALRAQGRYAEAERILRQAVEGFQVLGDKAGEGQAIRNLGGIHRSLCRVRQAEADLQRALRISRAIGDPGEEAKSLRSLAGLRLHERRYDEAEQMLTQALTMLRDLDEHAWASRTLYNLGRLRLAQGRLAEGDTILLDVLATFEGFHHRQWAARARRTLADLRLAQDRPEEAEELIRSALDTFQALQSRLWYAHGLRTLARVERARGRHEAAVTHLRRAVAEFELHEDDWARADAQWLLGGVLRDRREYPESRACLDAALEVFLRFEDGWRAARVLRSRARLLRATGQRAAARSDLRRARELGGR